MLGNHARLTRLVLLLMALSLIAGCKPKPPVDDNPPPAVEPTPSTRTQPPPPKSDDVQDVDESGWGDKDDGTADRIGSLDSRAAEFNRDGVLKTIFFATDRSELTPEARQILADNAAWMRANPDFVVVVEGHCDERNTEEYNLALGERRAESVRSYLVSLGISGGRIETISYGEERPIAPGNSEAAWSQNRRAQFVVKAS